MPVAGYLERDEESARRAPRFPLCLAICARCGLVQQASNAATTTLVDKVYANYQATYSASHKVSAYMGSFLDQVLSQTSCEPNDYVIEIGSNDGRVLRALRDRGVKPVGFDPAANLNRV